MTSRLKGKKGRRSESICTHRKVLLDNDEKKKKKVQIMEVKRRTCRGAPGLLKLKEEKKE